MKIEEILSTHEKKRLQTFLEDAVMKEAVKKVLLATIYSYGVLTPDVESDYTRNFFLSLLVDSQGREMAGNNEELGQRFRAAVEGIKMLDTGFAQLERLKDVGTIEITKLNKAR